MNGKLTHHQTTTRWLAIRPPLPKPFPVYPQSKKAQRRWHLIAGWLRLQLSHIYAVMDMPEDAFTLPSAGRMPLTFGVYPGSEASRLLRLLVREGLRCKPEGETLDEVIFHCCAHSPVRTDELEDDAIEASA